MARIVEKIDRFTWTALDELKINLARLKATEKNLHLNFDVRY